MCGAVVYLLRRLRPRWLVLIGTVMIAVPSLGMLGFSAVLPKLPPEALEGMTKGWAPPVSEITKELEAMRWDMQAEMMDQMVEEAQSNYEESKELFKLAMRILSEHYELQSQATQTFTRG